MPFAATFARRACLIAVPLLLPIAALAQVPGAKPDAKLQDKLDAMLPDKPIEKPAEKPANKVVAPAAPPPAVLESGLVGHWTGTLGYRDYPSDKMVELPMRTNIVALADGATILNMATFDDGPKRGAVLITTALLFDSKAGTVENVALERGRPIDHYTDKAEVVAYSDPTHWTIRYQHKGTDNKKPALIRTTEVREGNNFCAQEDVRAPDATDKDWKMRNMTTLRSEDIKPAVIDR